MQKIIPHLWYDKEAKEAAELYTSLIPGSKITNVTTIHDTPSGDCDVVSFELAGQKFMALSGGPAFKLNPSISFHVKCATKDEVEHIWNKLVEGGTVLMPLGSYPFSEKYGWLQDKYGLSWQIIYAGGRPIAQKITPVLTFTGNVCGKTEEAIKLYTSMFPKSDIQFVQRYGQNQEPDKEGTVQYAHFTLGGQEFGAMDSAREHKFNFNEAISFIVECEDQKEVDYFWEKLSAVPESEQCGWLKDKFGVSWQIQPTIMNDMMTKGTPEQIARVTQAFLKMKKFDIAALKKAFEG